MIIKYISNSRCRTKPLMFLMFPFLHTSFRNYISEPFAILLNLDGVVGCPVRGYDGATWRCNHIKPMEHKLMNPRLAGTTLSLGNIYAHAPGFTQLDKLRFDSPLGTPIQSM